jgi:hypothetical protein
MPGKKSIFDSDDVGCYERGWAAHTGKASVDDDVIALREDQAMLITEAIWKTAYKLEQPFATWLIPLTKVRLYVACAVGRRRDPRLRSAWGRVFGCFCEDCLV